MGTGEKALRKIGETQRRRILTGLGIIIIVLRLVLVLLLGLLLARFYIKELIIKIF